MWVATQDLPRSAAHPFYTRLNQILGQHDFDWYVERVCQRFYADDGRRGLPPGRYFRLLLIGYFEGLDAERAIAWRAADSFALREFLGFMVPATTGGAGLVNGNSVGIDATTLEANAALRSIVRRATGESCQDFSRSWRRPWTFRRPRAPTSRALTASGRRQGRTTTGPTRTIPTRRSRR